jgi:hypothetical protein
MQGWASERCVFHQPCVGPTTQHSSGGGIAGVAGARVLLVLPSDHGPQIAQVMRCRGAHNMVCPYDSIVCPRHYCREHCVFQGAPCTAEGFSAPSLGSCGCSGSPGLQPWRCLGWAVWPTRALAGG